MKRWAVTTAEAERTRLQNALIKQRKILIDRCAQLYSYEPRDATELRQLAKQALQNTAAVIETLTALDAKLAGHAINLPAARSLSL